MADTYAGELKRMFRFHGFDVRADMTHRWATTEDPGRSDGMIATGRLFAYVEFKDDPAGLDLKEKSGWRTSQRSWAAERIQNGSEYFVALVAGKNSPTSFKEGMRPRKAWLIAQYAAERAALRIIETCGQKLIPYKAEPGMKRWIQDESFDCVTLFEPWELKWVDGEWRIPDDHFFWTRFERQTPDFYQYQNGILTDYKGSKNG